MFSRKKSGGIKITDLNPTEKKFLVLFSISKLYFVTSIIIIYLLSKGFSFVEIAILDATFWGAIFIFEIPTGWVADKYGRKVSLFFSYLFQAFSLLLLFFEEVFYLLLLSFLIWGIATTLRSGAEQAWIYDQIIFETTNEKQELSSIDYRFHGVFSLLMATGLIAKGLGDIIGGIIASINLSLPILLTALTSLISALFLLIIPEKRPKTINTAHRNKYKNSILKALNELISNEAIFLFTSIILIATINSSLLTWSQAFFKNELGIDIILIGGIYGATTFLSALGSSKSQFFNNKLGEKFNLLLPSILGIIFFIIGMGIKILSISLYVFGAFFAGLLNPFLIAKINGYLSSETRATALSIISSITTVGVIIIEIITALIINQLGFSWFYYFVAMFYMAIIGPLLILWKKKRDLRLEKENQEKKNETTERQNMQNNRLDEKEKQTLIVTL